MLLEKAEEVVSKELIRSTIFDSNAVDSLPRFEREEVVLGRVLGRGGFCVVQECASIRLRRTNKSGSASSSAFSQHQQTSFQSSERSWSNRISSSFRSESASADLSTHNTTEDPRRQLARRVWSKRGQKFAVKLVEPSLLEDDRVTYLKGVIDLALEVHYLASLDHPHILTARGQSKTGPFEDTGYFIIMDQLNEVLSKRLTTWMHTHRTTKGLTGAITGGRKKTTSLLTERLLVAHDIADAMEYLHSLNIIYR